MSRRISGDPSEPIGRSSTQNTQVNRWRSGHDRSTPPTMLRVHQSLRNERAVTRHCRRSLQIRWKVHVKTGQPNWYPWSYVEESCSQCYCWVINSKDPTMIASKSGSFSVKLSLETEYSAAVNVQRFSLRLAFFQNFFNTVNLMGFCRKQSTSFICRHMVSFKRFHEVNSAF